MRSPRAPLRRVLIDAVDSLASAAHRASVVSQDLPHERRPRLVDRHLFLVHFISHCSLRAPTLRDLAGSCLPELIEGRTTTSRCRRQPVKVGLCVRMCVRRRDKDGPQAHPQLDFVRSLSRSDLDTMAERRMGHGQSLTSCPSYTHIPPGAD